jgi:hypothetical protein
VEGDLAVRLEVRLEKGVETFFLAGGLGDLSLHLRLGVGCLGLSLALRHHCSHFYQIYIYRSHLVLVLDLLLANIGKIPHRQFPLRYRPEHCALGSSKTNELLHLQALNFFDQFEVPIKQH